MGNWTTNIVLIVIVAGVVIFAIVTAITGRKNQRLEKEKRKKSVKTKIKKYLNANYDIHNSRIEYEKVVARKGKEYKYRDIFDVLVDVYEHRSNKLIFSKAFEIEGISHKVDKKKIDTDWTVNGELDYEKTKYEIQIIEGKIKLSKEELKKRKEIVKAKNKSLQAKKKGKNAPVTPKTSVKPQKFNPRG